MPRAEVESRERFSALLRRQAGHCENLGSPLYAGLLERAAEDAAGGGPILEVLRGHEDDPPHSALALRLMGALNRLRLRGAEPDVFAGWEECAAVLERRGAELRELVEAPVQTNEVGRSAALLFGFLAVAGETGLPLRLLELGASAGLNLNWDRYRYEADGFEWGPVDSPLHLDEWRLRPAGEEHPAPAAEVASREGCDAAPLDAASEADRLTLLAYVWPDQEARLERLRGALAVAAEHPVAVAAERGAAWTARVLAEPAEGVATVLFHSVALQYLSDSEREEFLAAVAAAGERATEAAPFAWLAMEYADELADLRLTLWPGGSERLLARVGYHGDPVELVESGAG